MLQIAYLLRDSPARAPVTFGVSIAEHWDDFWKMSAEVQEVLVDAVERTFAEADPEELPAEDRQRLEAMRWKAESRLRRGNWGGHFLREWLEILNVLNHPERAKTTWLQSPVGRLMVQLILVTPGYKGPTPEELREDSRRWIR